MILLPVSHGTHLAQTGPKSPYARAYDRFRPQIGMGVSETSGIHMLYDTTFSVTWDPFGLKLGPNLHTHGPLIDLDLKSEWAYPKTLEYVYCMILHWHYFQCQMGLYLGPNRHTRRPQIDLDLKVGMGASENLKIRMPYDSLVGDTWGPCVAQK